MLKRIRHIPDAARVGYTYCGRFYVAGTLTDMRLHLAIIDIARDCIEDAKCKACQRSDDRRTRETFQAETRAKLGIKANGR